MKEIGIVVVTYNRLLLLKEVIISLRAQSYQNFQIIVVNNGSTDGTQEWLEGEPDIHTITQTNLGGAGGFHTGIKYVAEHGFKYCWLMDDDVVCEPNALEELTIAYNVKPDIGFVCSKVIGIDGCPMNVPEVDISPADNGYPNYYDCIDHQMIKVKSATFVSVFLPVEIIKRKGLPYKEFFIWGDDTEYTSRISRNKDCYITCKSVVVHKRNIQKILTVSNEEDPKRIKMHFYKYRNNAYYQMNYNNISKLRIVVSNLKQAGSLFLKGRYRVARILFKATLSFITFAPVLEFPVNGKGLKDR